MAEDPHALFRRRLEERYGYADWAARAARVTAVRFAADPHALPGVRLERRSPLPGMRGHIDLLLDEQGPDGRVAVTVVEHADAGAAREALLGLLGKVMVERVPSCEERGVAIGEICFCNEGEPLQRVWFVRANVLVQVESIGARPLPVSELAAALDAQIVAALSA